MLGHHRPLLCHIGDQHTRCGRNSGSELIFFILPMIILWLDNGGSAQYSDYWCREDKHMRYLARGDRIFLRRQTLTINKYVHP